MKTITGCFTGTYFLFAAAFSGVSYAAPIDTLAGKALFQTHCASCHAVQSTLVGPALHNVFDRHTEAWIIDFVHSSQTVLKSGDTSAVRLFNQFNQTVMPDHPTMSDQDIKNIIGYIRAESEHAIQKGTINAAEEDNNPYKGESGIIRQAVYYNLPGDHRPVTFSDYSTWFLIGGSISFALLLLYILIKAKSLIAVIRDKNKPDGERASY